MGNGRAASKKSLKKETGTKESRLNEVEVVDPEEEESSVFEVYGRNPYRSRKTRTNVFEENEDDENDENDSDEKDERDDEYVQAFFDPSLKEQITNFEEVKEFIIHQLVVSYNLYKITKEIVDRVLAHVNVENEILNKLEFLQKELLKNEKEKEKEQSSWTTWLLSAILILQAITLLLLFLLTKG